ncbi:MAG: glycosyltransferase family 4 protein [Methanocellales archaeon]|nr:glycosyltransferase family 4 protein [Methanocellales archaeon]MDD3291870.1 glycosyltransferase family 4 protein [Methanocellales archaeon]MDD5235513.1 glycosyltransferase family 4 protein [Methanocellales archaeon]
MKICMFANGLPVHITGGMEIHVQELVEGLVKRDHKVTIITTKHPKGIKKEEKGNLRIYYVGDISLKCTRRFYKESSELFDKLNKEEMFDIVHSQSTSGFGLAKFYHKKIFLIVTLHGTALNEVKSALNTKSIKGFIVASYMYYTYILLSQVDKITLKRANKIIAVSNDLKEDIKKQYKISEEKLVAIPNGIDVNKFKTMEVTHLREKWNLTDEKVIISVGAINKQKGFHLLLKVFPDILKKNKNIKLFIVGTGLYLQDLKDMAMKLNILGKVVFTGRVSNEDLPKYYNLADVFVFPTLRLESFGLVTAEAMACEKPVIASCIGGIPTIIENNKDGILIKPGDLKELKERILEVLSNEELASRLGKNARKKIVEKFSSDKMVEDTIEVYEKVLNK